MEYETIAQSTPETTQNNNNEVRADVVNITQGGAQQVNATNVTLRQGGLQKADAQTITIRQGGVMSAKADHLDILQGGVGILQTQSAQMTASNAGALVARGDVKMDQSGSRILIAGGEVSMDQGGSMVTVARKVKMQNSGTVFLIANQVEGDVNPLFGQRESILFGAVAGLIAGTVLMLANLVRRRKR